MKKWFQMIDNIFLYSILCIFISCSFLFLAKYRTDTIRKNFNYDSIYQITGNVSQISISNDNFLLYLDTDNEKEIIINSGKKIKHSLNDEVFVYTDGIHYGISKEDIMIETTNLTFWAFIGLLSIYGIIISASSLLVFFIAFIINAKY